MLKLVNAETGEVLLESEEKISVTVFVDGRDRAFLLATKTYITTYLRDRIRERPDIKTIRARFGLENRMEI